MLKKQSQVQRWDRFTYFPSSLLRAGGTAEHRPALRRLGALRTGARGPGAGAPWAGLAWRRKRAPSTSVQPAAPDG